MKCGAHIKMHTEREPSMWPRAVRMYSMITACSSSLGSETETSPYTILISKYQEWPGCLLLSVVFKGHSAGRGGQFIWSPGPGHRQSFQWLIFHISFSLTICDRGACLVVSQTASLPSLFFFLCLSNFPFTGIHLYVKYKSRCQTL